MQSYVQIVKEALEVKSDDFLNLVEDAVSLLCKENGSLANYTVTGRLVNLKPQGETVIVGDLHGDLESLIDVLKQSDIVQRMNQNSNAILIFLGDYGDRGEYSTEVYYTVLKLKTLYPEQVILMRGNHEAPEDLMASPHDLPITFQARFGEKSIELYDKIRELFGCLYNAVLVEERYLMVHGGLPPEAETIEDLAYAHETHPKKRFLEDILWGDPNETVEDLTASPRGAGRLFGEKITEKVLKRFNAKILVRGHEPCREGYKINHGGRVLTLFSRKGEPYFNACGAYLDLPLSEVFRDAEQLIPYIHKF